MKKNLPAMIFKFNFQKKKKNTSVTRSDFPYQHDSGITLRLLVLKEEALRGYLFKELQRANNPEYLSTV